MNNSVHNGLATAASMRSASQAASPAAPGIEATPVRATQVLIAVGDQNERFRLGSSVNAEADMELAAVVDDAFDAIECAVTMRADVVVLDWGLRNGAGFAAREIQARAPDARVVAIGHTGAIEEYNAMLDCGALVVIERGSRQEEFVGSVRDAMAW